MCTPTCTYMHRILIRRTQMVFPLRGSCVLVSGLCVPVGPLLHLVPLQYSATWETGWERTRLQINGDFEIPYCVVGTEDSLYSEQPVGVFSALARGLLRWVCQEICWSLSCKPHSDTPQTPPDPFCIHSLLPKRPVGLDVKRSPPSKLR